MSQFIASVWQQNVVHIGRNNHSYFRSNIFGNDFANDCLQKQAHVKYYKSWNVTSFDTSPYFIDRTYSQVLNNLQDDSDIATNIVNDFQTVFGLRTQTNLYITPPYRTGLPVHADWMDVFVVQLQGSKLWDLYYPLVHNPRPSMIFALVNQTLLRRMKTVRLDQGDTMYIPAGVIHQAHSLSQTSTHMTIGVESTYLGSWESLLCKYVTDMFACNHNVECATMTFMTCMDDWTSNVVPGISWWQAILFVLRNIGLNHDELRRAFPFYKENVDDVSNDIRHVFAFILQNIDMKTAFRLHKYNFDIFENESLKKNFLENEKFFISHFFYEECIKKLLSYENEIILHLDVVLNHFKIIMKKHISIST